MTYWHLYFMLCVSSLDDDIYIGKML